MGLLLIVAALVIDHISVKLICTRCGNVTVQTANQCACCRALFVRDSFGKRLLVGLAQAALCVVLVWVVVWVTSLRHDMPVSVPPVRMPATVVRSVPVQPPPENDARLWALREQVVQHYLVKGLDLVPTVKPRFVTMRMRAEDASTMTDAQLAALATEGLRLWQSGEAGFFSLLITDSAGDYLVSADPLEVKILRR